MEAGACHMHYTKELGLVNTLPLRETIKQSKTRVKGQLTDVVSVS